MSDRPTPDYGEALCPEPGCILHDGHPPPCEVYLDEDD
jgi:hypothetical protein